MGTKEINYWLTGLKKKDNPILDMEEQKISILNKMTEIEHH
jgi:hypothetical protein